MRILYVEDQLSGSIPLIKELFGQFIGRRVVEELEEREHDKDGFGATNLELVKLLSSSPVDLAYTLPMALGMLKARGISAYDAFIIDRNLSESGEENWDVPEVQRYLPNCTEDQLLRFMTREGDLLLLVLSKGGVDLNSQAFFLTANAADTDALRGMDLFQDLAIVNRWRNENVIEKGSPEIEKLKAQLTELPRITVVAKHPNKFRAAGLVDEQVTADTLVRVIGNGPKPKWGGISDDQERQRFDQIRLLFEGLVTKLCQSQGIRPITDGAGTSALLGAIRDSDLAWRRRERRQGRERFIWRDVSDAVHLNQWTSVEDNIAGMVWDVCGAMQHYEPRSAYSEASWSKATLYELAYNGILHLYEWAGRSSFFGQPRD